MLACQVVSLSPKFFQVSGLIAAVWLDGRLPLSQRTLTYEERKGKKEKSGVLGWRAC